MGKEKGEKMEEDEGLSRKVNRERWAERNG